MHIKYIFVFRFPWFGSSVLSAMPPAKTDQLDLWAESGLDGDDQVMVDFLLPTGIYIQMEVPRESTIQHIKLVRVFVCKQILCSLLICASTKINAGYTLF